MALRYLAAAAASALAVGTAGAATTTFSDNGGVHEAYEYASDTFALPDTSVLDKFTFSLAGLTDLKAQAVSLGFTPLTGTVSLYRDQTADTLLGSFDFSAGSGTFASLTAGDYFYSVSASGNAGGGFVLGSYANPVPEPQTYALLLAGLGAIGFLARRRRAQ